MINNPIIEIPEDIDNISEYIDQNLQDDPAFEKILDETSIQPEIMPSCKTLDEYISEQLKYELPNMIKSSIENYNNIVVPYYRKKLKDWYFKRKDKLKNLNYESNKI